jgi:ABC-type Na+ efflux pump permease subunit
MVAVAVGLVALAADWMALERHTIRPIIPGVFDPESIRAFGAWVLGATLFIQFLFVTPFAAVLAGAAIAEEREKDTLSLLLLTRLTRLELAATKAAGRLMPALLLWLTGLPLIIAGAWIMELPAALAVGILAAAASTTALAASLGILASSRHDKVAAAQREATGWTMTWLVGLPMAALLPVSSGTFWGDLLVEVRRLARWLAPSSPLSLLTDPSWFTATAGGMTGALAARLGTMLAFQAALIGLAMAGAAGGLRLREPHPTAFDPHRGYRPPVGDDPIFWREYELPWRGTRLPAIVIYARHLLVALRVLLLWTLRTVALALMIAVPLAMVIGAGWFGYYAFREGWGLDVPPPGPYGARDHFNWFIRGVTFLLGVTPVIAAGSGTTARIVLERHKKTWEPLLTTPLTGRELLRSKLRVGERVAWSAVRWLIPLWLLGIVCLAVFPPGVLLAGAGLAAGFWLGEALGIRAAIRPGVPDQSANSAAALWSLLLMPLGGLTVVAPLAYSRDVEWLRDIDPLLPWLIAAAMLAATAAMAALAHALTRRCFERFDEWVGRPHRTAGPPAKGGRGPAGRDGTAAGAARAPSAAVAQ